MHSSDNQDRLCYKISFVKCILLFIWYSYSPGVTDSSKEEKRLMWVFLLTDKKKKDKQIFMSQGEKVSTFGHVLSCCKSS